MKRQKYITFQIKLGKAAIGNKDCYQTLILQDIYYLGAAGGTGRHCCFQRVHSRCDLKQRRMLDMLNLLELVIFDC